MNYLLIGGNLKWGSGKVVNRVKDILNIKGSLDFFGTNGLILSIELFFKIKHHNGVIIFQPSIARYSIIRDYLIFLCFKFLKKKYYLLILCDIDFSKWPSMVKKITNSSNCLKILSPAKLEYVIDEKNIIFSQQSLINPQHCFPEVKRIPLLKSSEINWIYGNYLNREKGLNTFLGYVKEHRLKHYKIFGSGNISNKITDKYKITNCKSEQEFKNCFSKAGRQKNSVYFYLSKYDLAPIVIEQAIINQIPICVIRHSRSHKIIKNFLGEGCFLYFDDLIDTTKVLDVNPILAKSTLSIFKRANLESILTDLK